MGSKYNNLVKTGKRNPQDYEGIIPGEQYERLADAAQKLQGARILHFNSTSYGGGVAEILTSELPILKGFGLKAEWRVLQAEPAFFDVSKKLHNLLHGRSGALSLKEQKIYELYTKRAVEAIDFEAYDFVVVHDPQPLPVLHFAHELGKKVTGKWVWRCHIPIAPADPSIWRYLSRFMSHYQSAIFTLPEYIPADFPIPTANIFPAIDPLSTKNMIIPKSEARKVADAFEVGNNGPLISQISRFDPWKDPIGVIDAFRLASLSIPDLRLILAGSTAADDPESSKVEQEIRGHIKKGENISVVTNKTGVSIAALQTISEVVIQKSIKEGFGLTVAEAMWKGTPVIGGRVGGIVHQIDDNVNGFLVDSVHECAEKIVWLLSHEKERKEFGKRAKEKVRQNFLLPRMVLEELELFQSLR